MRIVTLIILLATCVDTVSQDINYQFVFYNVENLYDTINDPNTEDDEYTPLGKKRWSGDRYNKKLDNLATVLSKIRLGGFPEIIGLCEVENKQVLRDLVSRKALIEAKYKIILENSRYVRGVDVALLYLSDNNLLSSRERELLSTLYSAASQTGSHTNVADPERARIMKNMVIESALLVAIRYRQFKGGE